MAIPDNILIQARPIDQRRMGYDAPTLFAYEVLMSIEFLRPALDIPHFHHEKWDGSGYPYGLGATRIPLAARIFAVVDVWDALRSKRHYKPARSESDACTYIQSQAHQHFDPDVVEAFLALHSQGQFTNLRSIHPLTPGQPCCDSRFDVPYVSGIDRRLYICGFSMTGHMPG